MRLVVSLIATALFLSILPTLAIAGEVVACGIPEPATLGTDPNQNYCNLYQRKLAYREEAMKQRQQIEERRANYVAPQISAVNAYKENTEALNKKRQEDMKAVAKASREAVSDSETSDDKKDADALENAEATEDSESDQTELGSDFLSKKN